MHTLLICYDIADAKRLRRVARLLEAHGRRVQQSVFLCRLPPPDARALREQLDETLHEGDRLLTVRICADCQDRLALTGAPLEALPEAGVCFA
jgi:CRISPR-associated protein Cas2